MINYLETDILTSSADTLVCPVNCVGVMGAGLAKQFSIEFPKLCSDYRRACDLGDLQVGKLWTWGNQHRGKSVVCFPTKTHWRYKSRVEYIVAGLQNFRRNYHLDSMSHIAFPKLGCGCGGLRWDVVRPEMERYLGDLPIRVDVHIF